MNNIETILSILVGNQQDIENMLQDLLLNRTIDTATGVQLDMLGTIVGEPRMGLDDTTYRRYCRARIATNRSNGEPEDLINIANLVVSDTSLYVFLRCIEDASLIVELADVAITATVATAVSSFLSEAGAAGVRVVVLWSESTPANTFKFDSGPGWDVGHLAGAMTS